MALPEHRRWMDNRVVGNNQRITNEFFVGVEEFFEFASQLDIFKQKGKLTCPCLRCKCKKHLQPDDVRMHLNKNGFMRNYYCWYNHGEKRPELAPIDAKILKSSNPHEQSAMHKLNDKAGSSNSNSAKLNDMLTYAQAPLWDGCKKHTVLSVALELLRLQSDHDLSDASMDEVIKFMTEALPGNHRMPANLYEVKKLVWKLGYLKIDDHDGRTERGGKSKLSAADHNDDGDEDEEE